MGRCGCADQAPPSCRVWVAGIRQLCVADGTGRALPVGSITRRISALHLGGVQFVAYQVLCWWKEDAAVTGSCVFWEV